MFMCSEYYKKVKSECLLHLLHLCIRCLPFLSCMLWMREKYLAPMFSTLKILLQTSFINNFHNHILFFIFFLFSASTAKIIKKVPAARMVEYILRFQITLLWTSILIKKNQINKNYWMVVYVCQINHVIISTNTANILDSDHKRHKIDVKFLFVLFFVHALFVLCVRSILLQVSTQPYMKKGKHTHKFIKRRSHFL